jgi:hypothetical protein
MDPNEEPQAPPAEPVFSRRIYIGVQFAPTLATTKVTLSAFMEWTRKTKLIANAGIVLWSEAICTGDGRITVTIHNNYALDALRDALDQVTDQAWKCITWMGNHTLQRIAEEDWRLFDLAPLTIGPVGQGNTLISLSEMVDNAPEDHVHGLSTHWEYHKVKTAATFKVWSPHRRNELMVAITPNGTKIRPAMPAPGKEDPTARLVYNNDPEVLLHTVDIEDVLDKFVPNTEFGIVVGQIYDPETETLSQKWLLGFCNSREAENFQAGHRTWFDAVEMHRDFGFKLTLGLCKSKPPPKENKSGTRGRGRGRGQPTRGRGRR